MNVRELTVVLLDEYELDGKYVNLSLSSHKTDGLSRADRAFLTALLYTTVEHKLTYDYYIGALAKRSVDSLDVHTLNILRLGMCQLLHMSSIPHFAAVSETVKLGRNKGERGLINGVLRAAERAMSEGVLPLPDRAKNVARYLSVAYSFPLWITKLFLSLYGEDGTEELLAVFNKQSATDVTVNLGKISREGYIELLRDRGIEAIPSERSRMSVRISSSVSPTELPGFDEGRFFVQDEVCAVSAEILGVRAGDSVLDVCAAPGGKSFAAAILAGDEGSVTSFDLHESKLSLIESGAARLGLDNIKVSANDASVMREELVGGFDRVICDVPCSGLGILGKKPDIRYRDKESVSELPQLQYDILTTASAYVKVGGVLLYSTCTLNPDENEEVVSRFLSEHSEFSVCDFSVGELCSEGGMLTTLPHRHGMDGFFMAKLVRNI